jgi:hypothetical protein
MPTMTLEAAREQAIDVELAKKQNARDEEARAVVRARLIKEEELARLEEQRRAEAAARAAFTGRAAAAHPQACTRYKAAVDEFRAARAQLQALDIILDRQGFGNIPLGVELRHTCAAPLEGDVNNDLGAALDSMRRTLGG